MLRRGIARLVKGAELIDIGLQPIYFDRTFRTNAEGDARFFQSLGKSNLFIVDAPHPRQHDPQTRIVLVDKAGHFDVFAVAIAVLMGEYHHETLTTLLESAFSGNGVDNAAIEHRYVIDRANGRNERQRRRGFADGQNAFARGRFGEIFGTSG